MFGIMAREGNLILCHARTIPDSYVLKQWSRNGKPVIRESAVEIDQLLQDFMVASGRYDLCVFKFTQEQTEEMIVNKLLGY